MLRISTGLALGMTLLATGAAHAAGDATAGKAVFDTQCAACHTTVAGTQGFGPSLAQLSGRKAGTLPGFHYTPAMTSSGLTWDDTTLDSFLTNSTAKVPGTAMAVSLSSQADRDNVIAYLDTLGRAAASAAPAPAAAAVVSAGPSQAELLGAASDNADWLYASKDYQGQRFAGSRQITPANAASMRPVCMYRSSTAGATQTTPLVYKGIMYLTIDTATVALDAGTCRERWTYNWAVKDKILSPANRGVAIKDGRVVRGTADGYLLALDLDKGTLLWSRKLADAKDGQYLSMPPLIFEDQVIYGPAGADWGARNWIGGFRLSDGEQLWRFNLIPDANEPGGDSWSDPKAREHGGGSVWTPVALDSGKGVLYVPVGNPAPDFYRDVRPGSNLYTDSVVALDVKSGRLLWYKQFRPADMHDWDLSQVSPLLHAKAKDQERDLMTVTGKDGLLRMLDRNSHEVLYEMPITTRENAEQEPTVPGAHVCPGLLGGMEWNGPAYDPSSNRLFVATVDWCGTFKKADAPPAFTENAHYYGGSVTPDPHDKSKGWLYAIDVNTGEPVWKEEWPTPLVAGVTATAGGMLFTGDLNNDFLAIDMKDGKPLYRFNTGGSIGGGVISYEIGGKQYVATTSGVVSGFFGGTGTSSVIVFALP